MMLLVRRMLLEMENSLTQSRDHTLILKVYNLAAESTPEGWLTLVPHLLFSVVLGYL